MRPTSSVVAGMRRSGIREVMELAQAIPDAIHLEVGEPGFPTPVHIVEAAHLAAQAGFTKYTASAGMLSLRKLLVGKLKDLNGLEVAPESIVVTPGAVTAIATAIMAVVEPGDEVLLPDPGWPNYQMMVPAAGAVAVLYPLSAENGFTPDLAALDRLVTPRTKAMVINSPGNPTGAVFSRDVVLQLLAFARRHDLYLISDEVYEQMLFEGEHVSPARFDSDGRVVTVSGFSKTYAMTGWRLGYAVAAQPLAAQIAKLQEPFVSCASAVSQKAGEAALTGPQDCVREMVDEYRRHRDTAAGILTAAGVSFFRPQGAFYAMVDIAACGLDSYAFSRRLLQEVHVAVAPGATFGPSAAGYVRVSLASPAAAVEEGVGRLSGFVKQLRGG
jgi:aspartate/methionine/tyrosine aminotransferase